eukprot:1133343-Amphidinium_carterae.1
MHRSHFATNTVGTADYFGDTMEHEVNRVNHYDLSEKTIEYIVHLPGDTSEIPQMTISDEYK